MTKLFNYKRFAVDYFYGVFLLIILNAGAAIVVDLHIPMVVLMLVLAYFTAAASGRRFARAFFMPATDMMVKAAGFWMTVETVIIWLAIFVISALLGEDILAEIKQETYLKSYWYLGLLIVPFLTFLYRASFRAAIIRELERAR